jgi:protein SCO1/2
LPGVSVAFRLDRFLLRRIAALSKDMATNIQQPTWVSDSRPLPRLWIALLASPILLVVLGAVAFAVFQPIQVLPRISLAPGYAFTDQDGNRLTSEDLRGSLVVYNFTYTACAEGCPQTSESMRQIQAALADLDTDGIPLRFVTISFDPNRDTPAQLRRYADSLDADTTRWSFVTGEPAMLKNVIGAGFRTYYNQEADGRFTFDPVFTLVDGWGILRATYRTATPDPATLRRDVGLIVQEARNRDSVNRYAYEAAHLFMCYPN